VWEWLFCLVLISDANAMHAKVHEEIKAGALYLVSDYTDFEVSVVFLDGGKVHNRSYGLGLGLGELISFDNLTSEDSHGGCYTCDHGYV
jgi:hypothetical protein